MKGKLLLVVSVIMIIAGGIIANHIQNDFCKIKVKDVRFAASDGRIMSALLFIPGNATSKTPAPGILATHGYINSRETQSGFAIEFARRGWVVLEMDQSGHGYSDPPVGAGGYGVVDGLAYIRSLAFVDKEKIGIEGHSMGGWGSVIAAAANPKDYKAMVLEGSCTSTKYSKTFVPVPGSPDFPRNLAVVYSTMDEFSMIMWEIPVGRDATKSGPLKNIFNTKDPIEPGKIYGSIEKGTARVLYQPETTHPGDHISTAAIGYAVEWFQKTLGDNKALAPEKQIWYWKEIATLIALVGAILLLFAAGDIMLETRYFNSLKGKPSSPKPASGAGWWIGAALFVIIPAITYFPLTLIGNVAVKASWLFPQIVSNTIMFWLVINAFISLILFSLWHFVSNRKRGGSSVSYGLKASSGFDWKNFGLSAWFAFLTVGVVYLAAISVSYFFTVDFRFWVIALKPLSLIQFKIALRYVIPFILFYLMFAVVLHGQLRLPDASFTRRMVIGMLVAAGGYLLLLLYVYVPLLSGGMLGVKSLYMVLYAIISIQILPLFIIVSLVSTYFYEKTGLVYVGVFVNAFFITWYIVAGQATTFAVL